MPDTWNPDQYHLFQRERSQPFFDLLDLVRPHDAMRIVDLGCGTGELTAGAHQRLHAASTLGVDSSNAMLEKCAAHKTATLTFQSADIATFDPAEPLDLVLSNAALQWLPDHENLFRRFRDWLRPHGQLAIQMPCNFDHPSHVVARTVASEPEFARRIVTERPSQPVLSPELYAAWLHDLGFSTQHVRVQVYGHILPTRAHVVEWVRGTLLTSYERQLPPNVFAQFLTRYKERLLPQLGTRDPYFYAFKRLLIWAEL